jgi:hypothetical protein
MLMKKGTYLFAVMICLSSMGMAQSEKVSSNLKLAYNASIIYPGFRAGIEYPIKRIEVTKYRRKRSERHFAKHRYLSGELGYYHHQTFHDNIYLLVGWQMRKQRPRGFFTEFSPAIGYSRTFLGGETYLVDDSGNISLIKWAGYNYAMLAIGGGCGYAFKPDFSAYFRPSLLTMFPSNNLIYIRPTVELGIIWQPKHFLQARPKITSKSKGKKR